MLFFREYKNKYKKVRRVSRAFLNDNNNYTTIIKKITNRLSDKNQRINKLGNYTKHWVDKLWVIFVKQRKFWVKYLV